MTAPDVARLLAWIEAGAKVAEERLAAYLAAHGPVALADEPPFCGPAHELAVYAALSDVVKLHAEVDVPSPFGGRSSRCAACHAPGSDFAFTHAAYPCPTLRALVALAGDGDSRGGAGREGKP